jgi:hypothetical protein
MKTKSILRYLFVSLETVEEAVMHKYKITALMSALLFIGTTSFSKSYEAAIDERLGFCWGASSFVFGLVNQDAAKVLDDWETSAMENWLKHNPKPSTLKNTTDKEWWDTQKSLGTIEASTYASSGNSIKLNSLAKECESKVVSAIKEIAG